MGRKAKTELPAQGVYLCTICDQIVESPLLESARCGCKVSEFVTIYVEDNAMVQSFYTPMDFPGG